MKYFWVASYRDNTTFAQFEGGVENSSEQISRHNLKSLSIHDGLGKAVFTIGFKPGDRFGYRCRTMLKSNGDEPERVHIIAVDRDGERFVVFAREKDAHIELGDFSDDTRYKHDFLPVPADLIEID